MPDLPPSHDVGTRNQFLDQIELIVKQDIVDIMLVSVSNLERLHEKKVFDGSRVKPAIRANLTTDCWGGIRHGSYQDVPSRPFRSVTISRAMTGTPQPAPGQEHHGTDLGLYSITFVNDPDRMRRRWRNSSGFETRPLLTVSSTSTKYSIPTSTSDFMQSRSASSSTTSFCNPWPV